jgi:hypothetical protein
MYGPDAKIGVLVEAGMIPDDSQVSKVPNGKKYKLKRCIKLYSNIGVHTPEIKAAPNTVFLVDTDLVTINQYLSNKMLIWWTTPEELWTWAVAQEEDRCSK